MLGPGEYVGDRSEGISSVEALPTPKKVQRSSNYRRRPCPRCGHSAYRDRVARRKLHDVGDLTSGRPRDIELRYSMHYCSKCRKYFSADTSKYGPAGSHYTHAVIDRAVSLVVEDGLAYRPASWHLWRHQRVFVPFATIQNWVEAAGKKRKHESTVTTKPGL